MLPPRVAARSVTLDRRRFVAYHPWPMTKEADIARDLLRTIRQLVRQISIHSKQLLRDIGLSVPQVLCLTAVAELEGETGVTVAEVSERVQLSPATVSRIVERLVTSALVTRDRSAIDRRKVEIALTPQGRERLGAMPPPLQETFLRRLAELPKKRQVQLRDALREVAALMSAGDLEAAPVLTPDDEIRG
jgi:DNA-binding MarR family transcriptional regulator